MKRVKRKSRSPEPIHHYQVKVKSLGARLGREYIKAWYIIHNGFGIRLPDAHEAARKALSYQGISDLYAREFWLGFNKSVNTYNARRSR